MSDNISKDAFSELKRKILKGMDLHVQIDEKKIKQLISDVIQREISTGNLSLPATEVGSLEKKMWNEFMGFGPLQPLMEDPDITEIMVNGPEFVYIEKHGKKTLSNVMFEDANQIRGLIEKMLHPTGKRIDELAPYVDFSLDEGSRINAILPPLAQNGPFMTIRKFLKSLEDVSHMITIGTLNETMASFLKACIESKLNIMFSGATGSGKTTILEVLSSYINEDERIVTIEDTRELFFRQDHVIHLLTRNPNIENKGEVTLGDLFKNSLRMRPSRIVLGEIRGGEALDFLQALNSGHKGCLAVIHASSSQDVGLRLESLILCSGRQIPLHALRNQISRGLDVIVQMTQYPDGSRKISQISEVTGQNEKGEVEVKDIFQFEMAHFDKKAGLLKGQFKHTGHKPHFLSEFLKKGIEFDHELFK